MRVNYIRPARRFRLPVEAVKTYQVSAPESTHQRPASCAEVDCPEYVNGWRVRLETLTEQQRVAVLGCGLRYRRAELAEGTTYLMFEAGQRCFRAHEHRLLIGRPSLYVVRDGDPWRGNPRGTPPRIHTRPELWVEDFGEHQQRLYERWRRG